MERGGGSRASPGRRAAAAGGAFSAKAFDEDAAGEGGERAAHLLRLVLLRVGFLLGILLGLALLLLLLRERAAGGGARVKEDARRQRSRPGIGAREGGR